MPQLLNYLNLDLTDRNSLDWGSVLVYSCSQHCGGNRFMVEYVQCMMFTEQGMGQKRLQTVER